MARDLRDAVTAARSARVLLGTVAAGPFSMPLLCSPRLRFFFRDNERRIPKPGDAGVVAGRRERARLLATSSRSRAAGTWSRSDFPIPEDVHVNRGRSPARTRVVLTTGRFRRAYRRTLEPSWRSEILELAHDGQWSGRERLCHLARRVVCRVAGGPSCARAIVMGHEMGSRWNFLPSTAQIRVGVTKRCAGANVFGGQ